MRYGVDTGELWVLAGTAEEAAVGLGEALVALARVTEAGIGSWCVHPGAAGAVHTAAAALEEQARAARATAGGLAGQLASAAQSYVDVDTPRPR